MEQHAYGKSGRFERAKDRFNNQFADITARVAQRYRMPVAVLTGYSRARSVVKARYRAIYECWSATGADHYTLARFFNKDHTLIPYALKRAQEQAS